MYQPFRPASVRGLLRTWFRAGAAACLLVEDGNRKQALEDVERTLRDAEGLLFGAASREKSRASALVLRPAPPGNGGQKEPFPKPERAGLRYAGYGLFEDKWNHPEAVVTPGSSEIHLPLRLRPGAPRLAEEVLAASIWLWTHLGGIGARSRRGWGSLELLDLGGLPWGGPPIGSPPSDRRDALQRLVDGLDHATDVFERYLLENGLGRLVGRGARHPEIRTLDGIAGIRGLSHTWSRPLDALDEMGLLLQEYRSSLARGRRGLPPLPDYHAVKSSLVPPRPVPAAVDRAAFGLPLPFYFRSLGGAKTRFVPSEGDRISSPLLMRVLRVGPGEHWGAALIYLAEISPEGEGRPRHPLAGRSLLQDGRPDRVVPEPDGALVLDFMEWAIQETRRRHSRPGGTR
jgi:CRISPR-associated protein Cmr1